MRHRLSIMTIINSSVASVYAFLHYLKYTLNPIIYAIKITQCERKTAKIVVFCKFG